MWCRWLDTNYRGVRQLVDRQAHNLEAGGSSPSPATNTFPDSSVGRAHDC